MASKAAAPPAFAVLTGPITGTVTLPDGTEVDVTDPVVMVDSQAMADAVAAAVGESYRDNGHPTDPNFTYVPPEG
jgi:hypothetical protein